MTRFISRSEPGLFVYSIRPRGRGLAGVGPTPEEAASNLEGLLQDEGFIPWDPAASELSRIAAKSEQIARDIILKLMRGCHG